MTSDCTCNGFFGSDENCPSHGDVDEDVDEDYVERLEEALEAIAYRSTDEPAGSSSPDWYRTIAYDCIGIAYRALQS